MFGSLFIKRLALLIMGLVWPVLAIADTPAGPRAIECYCTDKTGQRFELGDMVCLNVDSRSFFARCEMAQNVTTWREIGDGCMSSYAPIDTLMTRLRRL